MAKNNKHIEPLKELTAEQMRAYLANELSPAMQHKIEKYLLNNTFEAEAMEGYEATPAALEDLPGLKQRLADRFETDEQPKVIPLWRKALPYAASFALLLLAAVLLVYFMGNRPEINPISLQADDMIQLAEDKPEIAEAPTAKTTGEEESSNASTPKKNTLNANKKLITEIPVQTLADAEERGIPEKDEVFNEPLKNKSAGIAIADLPAIEDNTTDLEDVVMEIKEDEAIIAYEQKTEIAPASMPVARSNIQASERSMASKKSISTTLISGKIIDAETGEELPGVSVLVKSTNQGVTTAIDGTFEIEAGYDDILIASFIGMESEEVSINSRENLEIALNSDVRQLSEVVVTAYGEDQNKPDTYNAAKPEKGKSAFKKYVSEQLQYPDAAKAARLEGKVRIRFVVNTDGSLSNFTVLKSLSSACDAEAIRLIKEGPAWLPANRNDAPEQDTVTVSIKFEL